MKKRVIFGCTIAALSLAGLLAFSLADKTEAQRSASVRYEYAVINGFYTPYIQDGPGSASAVANICYLQAAGCQNEEIRADINIAKFLQDERLEGNPKGKALAQERANQASISRAVAKLGNDGFEIVSSPSTEFDLVYMNQQGTTAVKEGNRTASQHIWFKRVRQ